MTPPTPLPVSYPLASRTGRIDPFHVMELAKRAAALEAAGHPIIHMSIGEPDFTAPEPVVAALERAVEAHPAQREKGERRQQAQPAADAAGVGVGCVQVGLSFDPR